MAETWSRPHGLAGSSKSPGTITNDEHHDRSLSSRQIAGSAGTPDQIISDAATAQVVLNGSVLRVTNTLGTFQYLHIGTKSTATAATPDITDGFALPPNSTGNFFVGSLENKESVFIKASDNAVQVVVSKA